jgi:WD40 repeat protein/serine/threonine protein kinase
MVSKQPPDPGLPPDEYVRQALAILEADLRELALLALANWAELDLAAPELFRAIAALQRPAWGTWNGLFTSLRDARKTVLRTGPPPVRDRVLQSSILTAVLELLEREPDASAVEQLKPLSELTRSPLARQPRIGQLLALPIALRNIVVHFAPTGSTWWQQARSALAPLMAFRETEAWQPAWPGAIRYPEPWFVTDADGIWAFNGLREDTVLYVASDGTPHDVPGLLRPVLLAFQHLLGKTDLQEENIRRLLSRLAPEEVKGVFLGDYLVGRPVGSGGFAAVHVGTQLSTGRKVAVKILRDGFEEADRARFQQEAVFLSKLNHPHIVAVLGSGSEAWAAPREQAVAQSLAQEDWFKEWPRSAPVKDFIALEWIDGHTLEDVYQGRRAPAPTLAERAEWFAQAAGALAAVHTAGLLHRDVKPGNLMVSDTGALKLMDFGIARKRDPERSLKTTDGRVLGTPAYMAPEQLDPRSLDDEIGPASDVYGLCATFFEVLTGTRLFRHDRDTAMATETRDLQGVRPAWSHHLSPKLPWELNTILLGGLERGVAERYASASDLELDLRRYLQHEPIRYRRPPLSRRLRLWYERSPWIAWLTTAVLVLLAVGSVGASIGAYTINEARQRAVTNANNERLAKIEVSRQRDDIRTQRDVIDNQRLRLRRELFGSQMILANRDWQGAHVAQLRETLRQWIPDGSPAEDLRHFEWYYLWRLANSAHQTLAGHVGPVTAVAYSPDGTLLASACEQQLRVPLPYIKYVPTGQRRSASERIRSGFVRLWDTATGRKRATLSGHEGSVHAVAFRPDGQVLASAGDDGVIRWWETGTQKPCGVLSGHQGIVYGLAFSPDGRWLASAGEDKSVRLWDAHTGREIRVLKDHTNAVFCVAFSRNGLLASAGYEDTVRVWDAATGKAVRALVVNDSTPVAAVAFHPDGRGLVSIGADRTVHVWDSQTGKEIATLSGLPNLGTSAAISPDGRWLAFGTLDQTVSLRRTGALSLGWRYRGHAGGVNAVAFSPDGKWLASGSADRTVKVWDATSDIEDSHLADLGGAVLSVAFSPDGREIAAASDGNSQLKKADDVTVFDAATGAELYRLLGHEATIDCVVFSPDGRYLASAGYAGDGSRGDIRIWDRATHKELRRLADQPRQVASIAFAPDSKYLLSGSRDGTLKIWDTRSGQLVRALEGHLGGVTGVDWSRDGTRLASGSYDMSVRLWDAATGRELATLSGHEQLVQGVAFAPDGRRLASASWDGTVRIWDVAAGECLKVLHGHNGLVYSVTWSADGKRLFSSAGNTLQAGEIKVWDTVTMDELLTLRGHRSFIYSVAVSPSADQLVSGGNEGTVLRWLAPRVSVSTVGQNESGIANP